MRALILIIIAVVVIAMVGIGTGFIDINQIRGAQTPEVTATHNGLVAKGGQTPAFDVETGSVKVGAKDTTVKVPNVQVVPPASPANEAAPAANAQ